MVSARAAAGRRGTGRPCWSRVPRRPPRPRRSGPASGSSSPRWTTARGLVDLAFFDDSHDACAHTVFHSWLLLVRGVVQRRGPRSLSVVGAAAWNLAELVELRRGRGPGGGRGRGWPRPRAAPARARRRRRRPARGRRAGSDGLRAPRAAARDAMERRRIRMPTGYEMNPWADLAPGGRRAAHGKEVVAPESGECGMTILCVRFQLPPAREAALPALLGLLEESHARSSRRCRRTRRWPIVRGAERYFGRRRGGARRRCCGCARSRCTASTARSAPAAARCWPGWPLRVARPGATRAVPASRRGRRRSSPDSPSPRCPASAPRPPAPCARTGSTPSGGSPPRPCPRSSGSSARRRAASCTRRRTASTAAGSCRTPSSRSLAAERPFERDELDPDRHRRALLSAAEELGVRLRAVGTGRAAP